MLEANIPRILSEIKDHDVVLDVGGWAQPFQRANYVMDSFPYETRGWYSTIGQRASSGPGPERFSKDTWIQRDICDRTPFPFADKSIDYVICSHTLEDIRDPIWVCSELIRIGKRGYIEMPSIVHEMMASPWTPMIGAPHHRWLITISGRRIYFEMKYHKLHEKGLHYPDFTASQLQPADEVQWLFWQDSFDYEEATIPLGDSEVAKRLLAYKTAHPALVSWPRRVRWRLWVWSIYLRRLLPEGLRKMLKSLLPRRNA